jgi:16S rRNA (cytidine1402-2'-O)-methyltransferase
MNYPGCIMAKGTLYLIPALLADLPVSTVIPNGTLDLIRKLDTFIVEEVRTARRFLIKAGIQTPVDDLNFLVFNEHSGDADIREYLLGALNGHDIGLLSEAGVPCVADPGSLIVKEAHVLGIRVVPLTGPSSLLLALMASGFNGQNFAFVGYLPADQASRNRKIKELEKAITDKNQTQIFIETPYRNLQMFKSLIAACRSETLLCMATGITGPEEVIVSMTIAEWRRQHPEINKKPTIFLLYH